MKLYNEKNEEITLTGIPSYKEAFDYIRMNSKINSKVRIRKGDKIVYSKLIPEQYGEFLGMKAVKADSSYTIELFTGIVKDGNQNGTFGSRYYSLETQNNDIECVDRAFIIEKC